VIEAMSKGKGLMAMVVITHREGDRDKREEEFTRQCEVDCFRIVDCTAGGKPRGALGGR
jgi:hypothetical protein